MLEHNPKQTKTPTSGQFWARYALRLAKDGLVCADYSGVEDDIERIEAALEAAEGVQEGFRKGLRRVLD